MSTHVHKARKQASSTEGAMLMPVASDAPMRDSMPCSSNNMESMCTLPLIQAMCTLPLSCEITKVLSTGQQKKGNVRTCESTRGEKQNTFVNPSKRPIRRAAGAAPLRSVGPVAMRLPCKDPCMHIRYRCCANVYIFCLSA